MMRRIAMWVVCLILLVVPAWGMQHNTVYLDNDPPPIVPTEGDPLWKPTKAQLAEWVNAGIEAAAAGMYLPDLPVVQQWMWTYERPVLVDDGKWAKFMVVMSPELACTVAGYAAAWDENLWQQIQANPDRAVAGLVERLSHEFYGAEVTVAVGVIAATPPSPSAHLWGAVYYKEEWRKMDVHGASSLDPSGMYPGFLPSTWAISAGSPDARWATGYILSQMSDQPALANSTLLWVYLCRWPRRPTEYPRAEFVEAVGDPGLDPGRMRAAIGTSAAFAYTDWSVP